MSVGSNLQEMENVVTKGAAPAEPMPSAGIPVEDLGGPTPRMSLMLKLQKQKQYPTKSKTVKRSLTKRKLKKKQLKLLLKKK
jgi:hypothetical protein